MGGLREVHGVESTAEAKCELPCNISSNTQRRSCPVLKETDNNNKKKDEERAFEVVMFRQNCHNLNNLCMTETLLGSVLLSSHLFVVVSGLCFRVSFNVILRLPGCKCLSITRASRFTTYFKFR